MSKSPSSGWSSPTLSDMEYDNTVPNPIVLSTKPILAAAPQCSGETYRRLTRYLPEDKRDAFIGPLEPTVSDTILLIKKQCPSLTNVPPGDISLKVRFDGNTQEAVKDVLFAVLPEAWPAAISDTLPLVHVSVKPSPVGTDQSLRSGEKTWDDLKAEGALLGQQGWTDGPGGWKDGNGLKRRGGKSKAERYADTMKATSQMFEGS